MIDQSQLFSHPANRLATTALQKLKAPLPDGQVLPLLLLVQVWLESQPKLWELRQMAYELNRDQQDWVASLFVEDRESLQNELDGSEDGQEWPVFKDHLDGLYQAMKQRSKAPNDVAAFLAENLYSNLQVVFPDFGRQSPLS